MPCAISFQSFQLVFGRRKTIFQIHGVTERRLFPFCELSEARELPYHLISKKLLCRSYSLENALFRWNKWVVRLWDPIGGENKTTILARVEMDTVSNLL